MGDLVPPASVGRAVTMIALSPTAGACWWPGSPAGVMRLDQTHDADAPTGAPEDLEVTSR